MYFNKYGILGGGTMLIYLSLIETEVININNIQVNILTKNSVTQVYWTNEKVYFLYLEKIKMI